MTRLCREDLWWQKNVLEDSPICCPEPEASAALSENVN